MQFFIVLNGLRHFNKHILVLIDQQPPGVKKGFIKGEALRLLRTNSCKKIFEEKIANFKSYLLEKGYLEDLTNTTLKEVNFEDRKLAFQQEQKGTYEYILPFVTQYQPPVHA